MDIEDDNVTSLLTYQAHLSHSTIRDTGAHALVNGQFTGEPGFPSCRFYFRYPCATVPKLFISCLPPSHQVLLEHPVRLIPSTCTSSSSQYEKIN